MSTTNDQKDTVPSGDGMADKGEGSVARVTSLDPTLTESSSSDWSMVDSYGDIEDDETMSTGSSVEIVDEESESDTSNFNDSHTPVAGTSPSGRQLFILRLSTIKHISDPDTDEEKSGTVDGSQPSLHPDPVLHPQMVSEKLESLTQTLEGLKRQLSADSTAKPPVISLGPSGATNLTDDQRSCHTSDNDNNQTLTREPASMDMQRSSIQHRDDITDSMGHDTTEPESEPDADADPAPSTNVPTLIICVLLASMSLSVYLLFTVPFVNVNNPVTPNTVHDNNEAVGRGINYRVRLNEALQEIRDLKDEVGRLKYAAPSMGMIESLLASKQDMEVELTRQGVEASVSRQQLERTVNSTMARLETVTMERDNAVRETQQLKEVIHKLEAELLSAKTGTRSKGDTKYSDDTGSTETMGSCSRDNTESSGNAGSTENCGSTEKSGLYEDSSSGIAACWACLHKFQDDLKQFNFDQFKDYMPTDLMESLWEFMRKSRSYYESNGYTSDWYSHFTSKESTTEENAERQSETPKGETKQDYWTSILQMINTTKHHLEDTWTKVQSTSGDILKKHEPRLHALQDTFMKKMRKLNGKIQQKMSRKWKKWFGDNEGEQEEEEEEEKKEKHNNRRGKAHPTPQGHDNSQHRKEKGCKRGKHNKIKKDKMPEFEQKHSNKKNDPNLFREDNKKFQSDDGDDDSDDYFAAYDNDDDVAADWIDSDDDDNNYNMLYEDEDVRGENWYIEWAEDREYHREEPDDWFFQRQQRKNQATKKDI